MAKFSRKRRAVLVTMAMSVALAAAALAPAAQAYTAVDAWSESLGAFTWGSYHNSPVTKLDHVSAWYTGSGTVHVCEQTQAFNGWDWNVISEICANNTADGGSLSPWDLYSKRARIKNDSSFTHTINGAIYQP